jgi:D-sedoheptulose 7-phosphate isomerase
VSPTELDPVVVFGDAMEEHVRIILEMAKQTELLQRIAGKLLAAVRAGGKVLWCGNGGSAADSEHLAAELVGRFKRERTSIASIALTADSSVLTGIGNDYGYDAVFSRQIEALCQPGDVVVGLSTSGNSANVCNALDAARACGAITVAITGRDGGRMAGFADFVLRIDSKETARIQEAHILAGHMLCDWVDIGWIIHTEKREAQTDPLS